MSTDIAELGLKIDSSPAVKAKQDLDALTAAGARTEKQVNTLNSSFASVGSVRSATEAVSKQASTVDTASKSYLKLDSDVQKWLGTQDKVAKAMMELTKAETLLENARRSGVVTQSQYSQLMGVAAAAFEKATGTTVAATNALGMSSRETAQRVGTLTASLARGQTGEFTQSISSLIVRMGIMNPLLIGAGVAVAALAGYFIYGAVKAEQMSSAVARLSTQLEATGRAGVMTNQEISNLLQTFTRMPGVTQEAAEKVISSFAKMGGIAHSDLQKLISLVPAFAAGIGEDMPAAASRLAKAFDEPHAGVMALDKQFNILTLSQLKQIENMKKQGDEAGIAAIGIKALEERIAGLHQHALTPLETAINNLSRAWKGAMSELSNSTALVAVINYVTHLIESTRKLEDNMLHLAMTQRQERTGMTPAQQSAAGYRMPEGYGPAPVEDKDAKAAADNARTSAIVEAEALEKRRAAKERWLATHRAAEAEAREIERLAIEAAQWEARQIEQINEERAKELKKLRELELKSVIEYLKAVEAETIASDEVIRKAFLKKVSDQNTAQKSLDRFLDPAKAKSFGDALSGSFGKAGTALDKLISSLEDFGRKEAELAKMRKINEGDTDPVRRKKQELELDEKSTKLKLSSYGDMTAAAAGFFGEQSKGYQALMAMSQVFHAAELAMTLAETVPKAINAILTQGQGDPYTAFGRMAAMAAIVAGLGVMVGGGGGSAPANTDARDRQAAAGTGSVLGDAKAKSESITKAMDLMSRTSVIGNQYLSQMVRSLRAIEQNIGGLAALVVRSSGLTGDTKGLNLSSSGNALFGKTTRQLTDSGIQLNAQTVGQAMGGVSASGYTDIQTNKSSFFGLFKSSSTSRNTEQLSKEITDQFTKIVNDLYGSILQAAKVFGSDQGAISEILKAFKIDFQSISFKDLTGDEIEQQLRSIFSKLGDDMAGAAFEGLTKFQKVGEGAYETLMRLAQEFAATDAMLIMLGKDVSTAFGAIGFASIEARNNLVNLFGGIEELSDGVSQYYSLFYTEGEQIAHTVSMIKTEFDALGIAVPSNTAQFRKLVEAQDLSTSAGRAMFAALIQLAPAFDSVNNALSSLVAKIQSDLVSLYGGALGGVFAKGALDGAIRAFNAYVGSNNTVDQTIADLISGVNTQAIIDAISDPNTDPVAVGLMSTMLSAFSTWQAAINANTNSNNTNTTVITDNTIAQRQALQNRIADYLTQSLQSQLSPLTPRQKFEAARKAYDDNQVLASQQNVDAMQKWSGLRDAMLVAGQAVLASSPEYVALFNNSWNQGAGIAGLNSPPLTTASFNSGTTQVVDKIGLMVDTAKEAAVQSRQQVDRLIYALENGPLLVEMDPELKADIADIKTSLRLRQQ